MSGVVGTVLSIAGGQYQIHVDGRSVDASLRGRFKQDTGERVYVGDRVRLDVHADGAATIEGVEPRASILRRRMPGRGRGARVVAANLDQVIVVGAATEPRWDPHLVDRFLVVAEANDLPPVLVLNKTDLVSAAEADAATAPYAAAGYPVLHTSAKTGRGVADLADRLQRHVSLFSGPSGVGKSSLLNALQPGLRLRTAEVSRKTKAGRHTTVGAEMHPFGGGFVVDTPGLRDIALWGVDRRGVEAAFPEFERYAAHCRFDDCHHRSEPDCAVTGACERGELAESRLASYRRFLEEAEEVAADWR